MIITLSTCLGAMAVPFLNFVATKFYNSVTGSSKNFIWSDKIPDLTTLQSTLDFEELKKRTRIVVIDDEKTFPVSLFRNEGYSIDEWPKVEDYGKLQSGFYDIIVLDIKGVAMHISNDDGLGVLEDIKHYNPSQIIIAYSQHSFDLTKSKFWELADEKIAKPSDFLKMKRIIDDLITTKFNPNRYINTLHAILRNNQVGEKQIRRFDKEIYNSIKGKKKINFQNTLEFINTKTELVQKIANITETILKFFK
ncbi:hypothetical protein ACPPVU_06695 [Mucilaginibacter sp. McL0603]|uniref:hypothetical protein n=1 Tax=Mucilaginibacter sp. McL0603 TaxID=3415670 RepID=UPI003CE9DE48